MSKYSMIVEFEHDNEWTLRGLERYLYEHMDKLTVVDKIVHFEVAKGDLQETFGVEGK